MMGCTVKRIAFTLLVSFLAIAACSIPADADSIVLKGSLDRIGVTAVGTGIADATKYKDAELVANTKQANDYASKYSKDYTLFVKYEISYDIVDGKPTLDPTKSTIKFSMPTFTTLPITLLNVTGDFDKNMFTRFEFEATLWYPDLEKNFNIKNDKFKGFVDISDPKKPVVDITSSYIWQETFKDGVLIQPLATLTYKTTAKDNPGDGEFDPTPPGPAALPEPSSLLMTVLSLAGLFLWSSRIKSQRNC